MSLPLRIFTIVLDGMPFLPWHLNVFNRLKIDWQWLIVEGAAENSGSTSWCQRQQPRLSRDGTTEFLAGLKSHPRIKVWQRQWWAGGKDVMVQTALDSITEKCVLMQIDADEIWESDQLATIVDAFEDAQVGAMRFDCLYHVGPNIRTTGVNSYGANKGEWLRAWRFRPGMKMRHEPPTLHGNEGLVTIENFDTLLLGLRFTHFAYCFEEQVRFKEQFYGYKNAVEHWQRLQRHPGPWPVKLKDYLPWVDADATADLIGQAEPPPVIKPRQPQPAITP